MKTQTEILALAEKHGAFVGINDNEDVNMCAGDVLFSKENFTAFAAALKSTNFLRERAQLAQEWNTLSALKEAAAPAVALPANSHD